MVVWEVMPEKKKVYREVLACPVVVLELYEQIKISKHVARTLHCIPGVDITSQ